MDSAEFLDLLGNENRRRILQLLARKPCYVTEISEFLGVSPKAVIDHLRKLEEAGLVDSRTDDRRRKYFSINRHVRLEVTVSPYEFGTKSAYPASTRLDIASCRRLSIDLDRELSSADDRSDDETPATEDRQGPSETAPVPRAGADGRGERRVTTGADVESREEVVDGPTESVVGLAKKLHDLEQLERELSLAQRWTQGRITELRDALRGVVTGANPRLISELLVALADGSKGANELSRELDAPVSVVEELLEELTTEGVVDRNGHEWTLDA